MFKYMRADEKIHGSISVDVLHIAKINTIIYVWHKKVGASV
jgi:hypothetical protein